MNCFTIGNDVQPGLVARQVDKMWVVSIGHAPLATDVPLAKAKRETVNRFVGTLERRACGDVRFINLLDEDWKVTEEQAVEAVETIERDGLGVYRMDYQDGELVDLKLPRSKERERAKTDALVHVAACINKEDGALIYLSDDGPKVEEGGRMVRRYESFDKAKGVSVVAQGQGFYGEPHGLLRLRPGAGFRLKQEKPAPSGWFEMSLYWTGRDLKPRVFKPRKRGQPSSKRK